MTLDDIGSETNGKEKEKKEGAARRKGSPGIKWKRWRAEYNVAANWRVVSKLFVRWTCFESVEGFG